MNKIGIGMIGCGGMGRSVAREVVALDPSLEVRALCDPDQNALNLSLKELNPHAAVYKNYKELARAKDIDWVMIASFNCYHAQQAIAALQAGKDVFCQKPLATTPKDCIAMYNAWRESGKKFVIGFTLRYSPHYRKIKQLLTDGAIGKIISMEFNETLSFNHGALIMGGWRRFLKYAGTHLLEKCCHDIDLANWMVDSRAMRVASFGGLDFFKPENVYHIERIGKSKSGQEAYSGWPGLPQLNPFTSGKDIIDNQVAIIEYANGVRATFHTNCNAGIPERRMYILGTEGAIRADVLTGMIEVQRIGFDTPRENANTDGAGGHGGGDSVLAVELVDSMLKGIPPTVGMVEGVVSSITCFAIDKAMATGRVVNLKPYWEKVDLKNA